MTSELNKINAQVNQVSSRVKNMKVFSDFPLSDEITRLNDYVDDLSQYKNSLKNISDSDKQVVSQKIDYNVSAVRQIVIADTKGQQLSNQISAYAKTVQIQGIYDDKGNALKWLDSTLDDLVDSFNGDRYAPSVYLEKVVDSIKSDCLPLVSRATPKKDLDDYFVKVFEAKKQKDTNTLRQALTRFTQFLSQYNTLEKEAQKAQKSIRLR